ncbi:MAG: response regulator [Devosia sp.]
MLVEDEMIIALDMENTLTELGHDVTWVASVNEAARLADGGGFDLAIIDHHLKDGDSDEVAMKLRQAGIPFVVCSGRGGLQELGDVFAGTPFLQKPYTTDGLIEALSAVTKATVN